MSACIDGYAARLLDVAGEESCRSGRPSASTFAFSSSAHAMNHQTPRAALVLGALSSATDLAAGVPLGTSIRTALLATRLGATLGQRGPELATTYYTALLRHLGCTAFSHEAGYLGAGDDHDLLLAFEGVDPAAKAQVARRALTRVGRGRDASMRVRAVTRTMGSISSGPALAKAHCDQATALAVDLGMSEAVVTALGQIYERHAGGGHPHGLRDEAIAPAAKVLHVASVLEVHHRQRGRDAALAALRAQSGAVTDPEASRAATEAADSLWPALEEPSVWDAFSAAEPAPHLLLTVGLDAVALAFARYADLKSPVFLGHSPAVADLCDAAGSAAGLAAAERATLRRAALLHDLGVVAVPNGIWEKRGALDAAELDTARTHAFHGMRVLMRIPTLAGEARLVGLHHERCDGTGHPSGTKVGPEERQARILACAEVYCALVAPRPHRPALAAEGAAGVLIEASRDGALCRRSVDAVLMAAGHPKRRVSAPPAGLTERELDVLSLLARGFTNKESAQALGIAVKTVQHHIEHIYAKIGVTTRAAAALFAARHDLVRDLPPSS